MPDPTEINRNHIGACAVVLADLRLLQNLTGDFTDMSHSLCLPVEPLFTPQNVNQKACRYAEIFTPKFGASHERRV